MKRRSWLSLLPLLALAACGEQSASTGEAPDLDAPEPARFARPGPSQEGGGFWTRTRAALGGAPAPQQGSGALDDLGRSSDLEAASFSADALSVPALRGPAIVKRAGMAIDTDGPVAGYDRRVHRDPHRQLQTSLRYSDGGSLDPTKVPYIVVPIRDKALLGDLAVVEYRGKKVVAVVADCGPRWGEGSVALAERLGIPSDGISGGVSSGVTYTVYRGSGRRGPSRSQLAASMSQAQSSLGAPAAVASL